MGLILTESQADSQGKTGKESVIESFSKEMLLVAYDEEDVVADYKRLKDKLADPTISNRDFALLLRLAWDFRLPRPKQGLDVTSEGKSISGYSFEIVKPKDDKDS